MTFFCAQIALDLDPIVGIVGGQSISIEQAPWQAFIEYVTDDDIYGSYYQRLEPASCGGSIIHEKWILSAAHCSKYVFLFLFSIKTIFFYAKSVSF